MKEDANPKAQTVIITPTRAGNEALNLLTEAVTGKQGAHSDIVTVSDRGNERTYALRKIRKDRPHLHRIDLQ